MFTLFTIVFESFGISLAVFFVTPEHLQLSLPKIAVFITTLNVLVTFYSNMVAGRKINLDMTDSEMLAKVTSGLVLYSVLAIFYFIAGVYNVVISPFL